MKPAKISRSPDGSIVVQCPVCGVGHGPETRIHCKKCDNRFRLITESEEDFASPMVVSFWDITAEIYNQTQDEELTHSIADHLNDVGYEQSNGIDERLDDDEVEKAAEELIEQYEDSRIIGQYREEREDWESEIFEGLYQRLDKLGWNWKVDR